MSSIPLRAVSSARPDTDGLVPRTPHSRSGRFDEADLGVPKGTSEDEDSHGLSDSDPLLRDEDTTEDSPLQPTTPKPLSNSTRFSIIGLAVLLFLTFLVGVVYRKSEEVEEVHDYEAKVHGEHSDLTLISYENYTKFPLTPKQYRTECRNMHRGEMRHMAYWTDLRVDVPHPSSASGVCKSTVTYMLGSEVGLMGDLGLLAQVAALADSQQRTFFVDDSQWNRGKWSDYFSDISLLRPGPEPGCKPPPPEELVACPRSARHWVVSSQTAIYHLGHSFFEEFEDPYSIGLGRLKPIYEMALSSFLQVILPSPRMATLIRKTRDELVSDAENESLKYLGVHIRRGDRLGLTWKYHKTHLPTNLYVDAALETWQRLDPKSEGSPLFYIASDSPAALEEFLEQLPSNVRAFSLVWSDDEQLKAIASPRSYVQEEFNTLSEEERIRLTKGMIVDFALLTGLWINERDPDVRPYATVCGLSSTVCRLSALGFGWDGAFGSLAAEIDNTVKRWVEIDNAGGLVPQWEPFELFE
ncbi:hypothetical protein BDM02DRAFT_3133580 [Thelephora ganbajun]|uniref:Uncharacterized protein n=1 Tax=Thelephora ganbajun TaxID=370292 RepID=A0ACB6ZWX4_THEGA|nr:hypothetical protein BDM02DRAFT_3133580 [Thelephora ganbajun]